MTMSGLSTKCGMSRFAPNLLVASQAIIEAPPTLELPASDIPSADSQTINHMTPRGAVPASGTLLRDGDARASLSTMVSMPSPFAQTINAIRELHSQRRDLIKTEGDLTRRVRAICRRSVGYNPDAPNAAALMREADAMYKRFRSPGGQGSAANHARSAPEDSEPNDDGGSMPALPPKDHVPRPSSTECSEDGHGFDATHNSVAIFAAPAILDAEASIRKERMKVERLMVKQAKTLPAYAAFVEGINGFGALGFAQIIGECGDLSNYANPAKVWKRMGLGIVGGERQRKHADAAKALEHGYSPIRRSTMFVLGDSLLKKQSPYRDLYLARKEVEAAKAEAAGLTITEAGKLPKGLPASQCMSKMHIHRRAQRYVEKRLLRDLWRAWRTA